MYKLNLPAFDPILRKKEGKVYIFDNIRKKFILLTPEEWVRQHFINYLIHHLHYPRTLFRIEGGLIYNQLHKRSDILLHDRSGRPWMLIECKSPDVKITQKVFNQVTVYNKTIGAPYIGVTNGLVQYCFQTKLPDAGEVTFLKSFPAYPEE
jgi:hypothetical protein